MYADGAGRVDTPVGKTLPLMGAGLALKYSEGVVYFTFGAGSWSTATKSDSTEFGICDWKGMWTKSAMGCGAEFAEEYRVSCESCVQDVMDD
jgi:hypothetical protein